MTQFHRRGRITRKCHLAERFPRGSKDTQVTDSDGQTLRVSEAPSTAAGLAAVRVGVIPTFLPG